MYAWIWRHLPFGRYGKLAGSLALAAAVAALLWYVVFPWAEPILPFDDVQVGTEVPGAPADPGLTDGPAGPGLSPPAAGSGDHDLPYPTTSNNPPPSPSR